MTHLDSYLPSAGDKVGGFLLLEPLGRGAMGQVYRAQDETLGREVAIKFIDLSSLKNEVLIAEVKKRFIREARVLAAINHPNVVAIYSASLDFRCPYIVMEYFPGKPLFEYQDEFGVIDYKRCCLIGLQICEALDYCWENYQVMHRDLKPANILIQENGHIKIIDWGIAKVTKDLALGITLATRSDMRLGTPHFMAPEQQINPGEVTYVADIYSMGVIMWQMLTGSPPFDANSEAVLYAQKIKGPQKLITDLVSDLPPDLGILIHRMIEPDPNKRISSYAEIRSILQREINKFGDLSQIFPKKERPKIVLRPLPPIAFQSSATSSPSQEGSTPPSNAPALKIKGLVQKQENPTQAASSTQKKLLIIKKPQETPPSLSIPSPSAASDISSPVNLQKEVSSPKKVKLAKSGPISSSAASVSASTTALPTPAPSTIPPTASSPLSTEKELVKSKSSPFFISVSPNMRISPLPDVRILDSKISPNTDMAPYRLIERLGMGATGVVYRAEKDQSQEEFALKFLITNPADLRRRWQAIDEYLQIYHSIEDRVLSPILSAQVINGYFCTTSYLYLGPEGRPFSLIQACKVYGTPQGFLNQYDVRSIALLLLQALEKMHNQNLCHMNIKPSNILFPTLRHTPTLEWFTTIKLTDAGTPFFIGLPYFGKLIRKALPYYCVASRMKPDIRALLMSYDFMSPELKRGEPPSIQSDLYSLAMVILWALTGIPHLCLQTRPSHIRSGVDPAWDPIFFKALQENPARRYPSASAMAADIAALPF